MSKTLLKIVQDCLSTLDSDTVDTIGETYEAVQIATLVENEYYDFVTEYGLPTNQKLSFLEGVGDAALPTHLKIPDNVKSVHWWKYDCRLDLADPKSYNDIVYLNPKDFVNYCNARNSTDTTNYQVITLDSEISLVVGITKAPTYWTTFDNEYIVSDSLDTNVDATLQQSKTQAFLEYGPAFSQVDTFVPDLPSNLEALFYRTCENTAYALFKQTVNPKLEIKERRLRVRAQRNKYKADIQVSNYKDTINYGR